MRINIPIFRAKKLDSDEYVMGWYSSPIIIEGKIYLSITNKDGEYRIDPTTLSIHFLNMLDSQGNEIFASLQEDGKGGDIIETELKRVCTAKYKEYFFYADNKDYHCNCFGFIHSKIIGIQQWS